MDVHAVHRYHHLRDDVEIAIRREQHQKPGDGQPECSADQVDDIASQPERYVAPEETDRLRLRDTHELACNNSHSRDEQISLQRFSEKTYSWC